MDADEEDVDEVEEEEREEEGWWLSHYKRSYIVLDYILIIVMRTAAGVLLGRRREALSVLFSSSWIFLLCFRPLLWSHNLTGDICNWLVRGDPQSAPQECISGKIIKLSEPPPQGDAGHQTLTLAQVFSCQDFRKNSVT